MLQLILLPSCPSPFVLLKPCALLHVVLLALLRVPSQSNRPLLTLSSPATLLLHQQGGRLSQYVESYTQKCFQRVSNHSIQVATRGVKTLNFAGTEEVVYERSDWPLAKLQDYFKNDTLALIGYGSQGHGQGLNARDNGLNVIVGVRKDGESWKQAIEDGWV